MFGCFWQKLTRPYVTVVPVMTVVTVVTVAVVTVVVVTYSNNKGRNGTNHGLFRKLYVCQESCTPSQQLNNVNTVVRKLWESCEKGLRKLWESYEKVVRKLWESCEKVVRTLWESCEKVVRKLRESCEIVVRKLWDSCEKVYYPTLVADLSRHVCTCLFSHNLSEFRCPHGETGSPITMDFPFKQKAMEKI